MAKRLSTEIKKKVLQLLKEGMGYRSIASTLGLNRSTVKAYSLLYRADNTDWVENEHVPPNPELLDMAVREYLDGSAGLEMLSSKYGIRPTSIRTGAQNFLNHGVVRLPKGRNSMKRLQAQKKGLRSALSRTESTERRLTAKEAKELRELLEVNIAVIDVILEMDIPALKKKDFLQQKKRLQVQLASVEHAHF